MHPSELKNRALTAAAAAENAGYPATAEAFRYLAMNCIEDATSLIKRSEIHKRVESPAA
jgi:hypothetical protein